MANAPITPERPNLDGHVVQAYIALATTGATTLETVTLNTYDYKIDIRIGHPVLGGCFIEFQTDVTGSEVLIPANEMARGVAGDSAAEWSVNDKSSIKFYKTADKHGLIIISYIAYGVQKA